MGISECDATCPWLMGLDDGDRVALVAPAAGAKQARDPVALGVPHHGGGEQAGDRGAGLVVKHFAAACVHEVSNNDTRVFPSTLACASSTFDMDLMRDAAMAPYFVKAMGCACVERTSDDGGAIDANYFGC